MAFKSTNVKLYFPIDKNPTGSNIAAGIINVGDPIDELMSVNSWAFPGLQEVGSIAINGAGGSYDQIEVTTLADNKHVYIDGLISDSATGSNEISCKFLYEPTLFKAFKDILDGESNPGEKEAFAHYVIAIPEGGYFEVEAGLSSVNLETVSINSALTFTVGLAVRSIEMKTGNYTASTSV